MGVKSLLGKLVKKVFPFTRVEMTYLRRYKNFGFANANCNHYEQYEACITRFYHTIEKGLSYENYRAGFGKDNVNSLLDAMESYIHHGFDCTAFFYETALSTLRQYIEKNKAYGISDSQLEKRVCSLPGNANEYGGIIEFTPYSESQVKSLPFADLIKNRHSIRHFSSTPVPLVSIKNALNLAQHTPSACNRQGWKTRIITDKNLIASVLKWQNGNRGFGKELDKLLLITSDTRYFNKDRESFQAFIDGGMYAANILNGLHYEHIGSIPLSASLTFEQEKNVRNLLNLHAAEVLILFIGIGSYPDKCRTTRSERRNANIKIL
ncbi:MAG: nitroreductase family protein [Fibrobacter sp.]|nr:nitroreductase family protein [Fibrobacter sp.]